MPENSGAIGDAESIDTVDPGNLTLGLAAVGFGHGGEDSAERPTHGAGTAGGSNGRIGGNGSGNLQRTHWVFTLTRFDGFHTFV